MPGFRRALACAAMAMAAAGGGLAVGAAGATPAHAATPAHPAGGHTTTTSFTAVPAAQATGGIGPKFQCGDTCDPNGGGNPPPPPPPPTITCTISVDAPYDSPSGSLVFGADTTCTGNVARITMVQNVVHTPGGTLTNSADVPNFWIAQTTRTVPCVTAPDSWSVSASATITPPAGWVIIAGHNPIVASTPMPVSFMNCNGSAGGGGGCATGTPSVPAQPAARQPEVVTC
jgi:hypothetical protein